HVMAMPSVNRAAIGKNGFSHNFGHSPSRAMESVALGFGRGHCGINSAPLAFMVFTGRNAEPVLPTELSGCGVVKQCTTREASRAAGSAIAGDGKEGARDAR